MYIYIMCILSWILLGLPCKAYNAFDSVSHIASYAEHIVEYPEPDNADLVLPDFSSLYESQRPTRISRIKNFFGLNKNDLNLSEFEQILQEITSQRVVDGFRGEFVQELRLSDAGRLIIFGDLQGAFHSFVRSLKYLVTQDIISEKLILQDDDYLIFNGNVINSAAYNLEMLITLISLIKKNPKRIIYLKGAHEHNLNKETSALYKQLKIVAEDRADALFAKIELFFDTLPCALYVVRDKDGALKIFSEPSVAFDDSLLGSFLSLDDKTELLYAGKYAKKPSAVPIGAIIKAYDGSRTNGLKRYVGPPSSWALFSSPTGVHRRLLGFFKDAFAIVDSAAHFHDWLITLYVNDLQEKVGFGMAGTYNLYTGVLISGNPIDLFDTLEVQKFEKIISEKKKLIADIKAICLSKAGSSSVEQIKSKDMQKQFLRIGTSIDLSKSANRLGLKIKETLTNAFEEKNKQGGVRGVTFQDVILDDAYTPEIARQNYLKFVNELGIDIILASYGTATIQQSLDLIKDNKMILLFPAITESGVFRQAELKNIVSLSVSYYEQGKALINCLLKNNQPGKIALFYQDDDFGKDGLGGAKYALNKHGFTNIIELPYGRNQVDFSTQVNIIEKEQPDAIGFFSLSLSAIAFMKAIGVKSLSRKMLFGISDLRDNDLLEFLKEKGLLLMYVSPLPDWRDSSRLLAQDYLRFTLDNNMAPDPFSFEIYVIVQIFFYLIEQVQGEVTKEKLIKVAEEIKDLDFKGLHLTFDPKSRALLDVVWITKNDGEQWFKVPIKKDTDQAIVQASKSSLSAKGPSIPN